MSLILTRHCTTHWNRERRIQGQTDVPLDQGGIEEATELGKKLVGLGIERIVSSDLTRAVQTAEIIGQILDLPVTRDERLREANFGRLEGMTREEALKAFGEAALQHWENAPQNYDLRPLGGEDRATVAMRHLDAVVDAGAGNGEVVLIVGHGRGLNTLLDVLEYPADLPRNEWRAIEI